MATSLNELNNNRLVGAEATKDHPEKIVPQVLEAMFGPGAYGYDMKEGTVISATDNRVLYLSADLVRGIYQALEYETGEAWKLILKNCGYIWGKRISVSLGKELRVVIRDGLEDLSVHDYLNLIESYFASHGWGIAVVDLDDAQTYGIVRVSLKNSLFVHALDDVQGRVDYMMAGMLRGLFEAISGHMLDCVQVCCERSNIAQASEFLISARGRIETLEASLDSDIELDHAIEQLRAA